MIMRLKKYFGKRGFAPSDFMVWVLISIGVIIFAFVLFFVFNQSSESLFSQLARKIKFGGFG